MLHKKKKLGNEKKMMKENEKREKIIKFIYLLYILFGEDKIHLLKRIDEVKYFFLSCYKFIKHVKINLYPPLLYYSPPLTIHLF